MWNEVKEGWWHKFRYKKVLSIVLSIQKVLWIHSEVHHTPLLYSYFSLFSMTKRTWNYRPTLKELWEAHIQFFLLMNSGPIIISPLYSLITGFRICCIVNKTVCSGVSSFSLMEMAILHCWGDRYLPSPWEMLVSARPVKSWRSPNPDPTASWEPSALVDRDTNSTTATTELKHKEVWKYTTYNKDRQRKL